MIGSKNYIDNKWKLDLEDRMIELDENVEPEAWFLFFFSADTLLKLIKLYVDTSQLDDKNKPIIEYKFTDLLQRDQLLVIAESDIDENTQKLLTLTDKLGFSKAGKSKVNDNITFVELMLDGKNIDKPRK